MKQVINIVVDIETLSLQSDAAIVSIAAVPFNPRGLVGERPSFSKVFEVYPREAEETLGSFYEVVNATSCALAGMHIDMDTVQWWSKQDESAKAELLYREPLTIGHAMNAFHNYIESIKKAHDVEVIVWAQGSDFDFPILTNAYSKVMKDAKLPWHYRNKRDARSIVLDNLERLYGVEEKPYDRIGEMPYPDKEVKHSALYDAHRTAWSVAYVNYLLCQNTSAPAISDTIPK